MVIGRALTALGATGGALLTRTDGGWQVAATETLDAELRRTYSFLPHDSPFPAAMTARTGERILLPSRDLALAEHPVLAEIYARSDRVAFACLPLSSRGRRLGAISLSWAESRDFTEAQVEMMDGFAAQCAIALDRIDIWERQRRTADQIEHLAEALQSAMLTPPPATAGLDIAACYRSANDVARVGGDWYDAFLQPGGDLVVVIGDVCGHDDAAAGTMGQVRGLLRALAYDEDAPAAPRQPAAVLTRFEAVARGLEVDELATAVLARIGAEPDRDGSRSLVWSNAGNCPPVLLLADGTTRVLEGQAPDLVLGVDPGTRRTDLATTLPGGSTLLLYTDGLVERRDASIDAGLDDLRRVLSGLAARPLSRLCDLVLTALDPHTGEDDIAMVAVRV